MKVAKVMASVFAVYVALGLTLDAAIGYFQPQSESTAVLRTLEAEREGYWVSSTTTDSYGSSLATGCGGGTTGSSRIRMWS